MGDETHVLGGRRDICVDEYGKKNNKLFSAM